MSAEEFSQLWQFESGQEVCIKHHKKDGFFKSDKDGDDCGWDGSQGGAKTIFVATVNDDGTVEFESNKTGKFLRIDKDGQGWRCDGKDDKKNSSFVMEKFGPGRAILTCEKEFDGEQRVLGAPNKNPCPVTIYTRGDKDKFATPFVKADCKGKTVLIRSCLHLTSLKADKKEDISCDGKAAGPCQWKIIIDKDGEYQFFNEKREGCVAMKKDGTIMFEDKKKKERCDFDIIPIFDHDHESVEHFVYIKSNVSDKYLGYHKDKAEVKAYDEPNEFCRWAIYFE